MESTLVQEPQQESWVDILHKAMAQKEKPKPEPEPQQKPTQGLYTILFRRLEEIRKDCHKEIIPFPVLFEKLCRNFSISKQECWDILFMLRDVGLIEIVPYRGVKFGFIS